MNCFVGTRGCLLAAQSISPKFILAITLFMPAVSLANARPLGFYLVEKHKCCSKMSGRPSALRAGSASLVCTSILGLTNESVEKPTYHPTQCRTIKPFLMSAQAGKLFPQPRIRFLRIYRRDRALRYSSRPPTRALCSHNTVRAVLRQVAAIAVAYPIFLLTWKFARTKFCFYS